MRRSALLLLALLGACSTPPTAPAAAPVPVRLQVFGRSHQDNPWSWTGVAVVATPDSMFTTFKPGNDSSAWDMGALPIGTRICIMSPTYSALPDSAWWIAGRDTTRLYLAMGGVGDLQRVFTVEDRP